MKMIIPNLAILVLHRLYLTLVAQLVEGSNHIGGVLTAGWQTVEGIGGDGNDT